MLLEEESGLFNRETGKLTLVSLDSTLTFGSWQGADVNILSSQSEESLR